MHKLASMFTLSPLSDGSVYQTTGSPPIWCLTIHLLHVQAASDCSLPATEGNHSEHLEHWHYLTPVKTNVCLSSSMKPGRTAVREITWLICLSEVVYSQMNTTWNSDQQTFLNPVAAPLCELYASQLTDSAELFKQWILSGFQIVSLLPKLLPKPR